MTNSETLKFELWINDKERSYIRECSNNILLWPMKEKLVYVLMSTEDKRAWGSRLNLNT